jgi:hypothetical protein
METRYEISKTYRRELNLTSFRKLASGALIAKGNGLYPELDKDNPKINWIAIKGFANDWAIYYGKIKDPHEYIHFNGKTITDTKIIKELVNCTDEVFKLYRK